MAALAALTVATAAGHTLTYSQAPMLHAIFEHLYFLPIALASMWFGWGGLLVAAIAAGGYLFASFTLPGHLTSYAETLDFLIVGLVTGVLGERESRSKNELRRTAEDLGRTHAELQQSLEQVKRSERLSAVGELASGLAHELRNPIASLSGASAMLRSGQLTEAQRAECIEILARECERIERLLTDLLGFARPRTPEFHTVPLGPIIDSVAALMAPMAARQSISINKRAGPELPPARCDAEQIRQVLLNLTLNAVQAMPDGGQLTLAARSGSGDVIVSVCDTGPGIDPVHLERIFDPFYTTKANGTGLGLSVAQRIVQQHGGHLEASPNPDRGMTFTVRLPLSGAPTKGMASCSQARS